MPDAFLRSSSPCYDLKRGFNRKQLHICDNIHGNIQINKDSRPQTCQYHKRQSRERIIVLGLIKTSQPTNRCSYWVREATRLELLRHGDGIWHLVACMQRCHHSFFGRRWMTSFLEVVYHWGDIYKVPGTLPQIIRCQNVGHTFDTDNRLSCTHTR